MEIESGLLNLPVNTIDVNIAKDEVLYRLWTDGIITTEEHDHYCNDWQILIIKKSWFKSWCDKWSKGKGSDWIYKYVKFEDKIKQ